MKRAKESISQSVALYTAADFYLLRAPVLSAQAFLQMSALEADFKANEESEIWLAQVRKRSHERLLELISRPLVMFALSMASTDIFTGIARIQRNEDSQRVTRTYSSLLRYLVRMSTRPTPFGLFAGVAMGTFAERTTVRLAVPSIQQLRTRPDMGWLLTVITDLEQMIDLLPQLYLMTNQAVYFSEPQAVYLVEAQTNFPGLRIREWDGKKEGFQTSRALTTVQYVLEHARYPVHYQALRTDLLRRFAKTQPERIDRLLQLLWENHLLISNLRPPLIGTDPVRYLMEQIPVLPIAEPVGTALKNVLQKLDELDHVGIDGSTELVQDLIQRQKQLAPASHELPFQVDAVLRLHSAHLHKSIGEAAAQAGETLLRLSRNPDGPAHLLEFRRAFVERYGIGTEVPLLDLLDAESGLDAPSTYKQPARTYRFADPLPQPDYSMRDAILYELVVRAVNERSLEVELNSSLLQRLERWFPQTGNPPPASIEIYLQIQAVSREALDKGEWSAVVSPGCSSGGGCTFSRFFDILGTDNLERLREFAVREQALFPDVIFAELSYLPSRTHVANAAVRPALYAYEIVVNTTPSVLPEKVIYLHDLVIGVRDNRFYVRSLRLGKEVVVRQSHMLHPKMAPNVCRFLIELARDNCPELAPFDWGAVRAAPFLPRIVQGRVVLSPAQWNVRTTDIESSGTGSEEVCWLNGLRHWRERWRVPRYVYLANADNRLLLDLEHPLLAAELRGELRKAGEFGSVTVQEMLPDFAHLWLRDSQDAAYFAEIVVPLLYTNPPGTPAPRAQVTERHYPPCILTREERQMLPGALWTYLKLYAAFSQHDTLLAEPMREIVQQLQEQGLIDRWFFVRYADPEPHIRLRFHAREAEQSQALLIATLNWARQQAKQGLCKRVCVDTYEREIERYGGPQAIDILEEVFTINSSVLNKVIAARCAKQITLDATSIAVFSLDQFFIAWGLDLSTRLRRLEKWPITREVRRAFHSQRGLFCELLAPWGQGSDPALVAQREQLHLFLSAQIEPLNILAVQLRQLASSGGLWESEEQILDSLAHMHLNRLLGTNREQERTIYAFWRLTLESVYRRPIKNI